MLVKSEALVLKRTAYAENSAVIHLFTRQHGQLAFLVPGMHGKSGKTALLRPGSFIEAIYYLQGNRNLRRLKEIKSIEPFLTDDPVKGAMTLFCTEATRCVLPEEHPDEHLYGFVKSELMRLNRPSTRLKWFIHAFLLRLMEECGHGPDWRGKATHVPTGMHRHIWAENDLDCIQAVQAGGDPEGDRTYRRELAEKIIGLMQAEIFPGRDIKSFKVLLDLFD